jgi:hypothetical protein
MVGIGGEGLAPYFSVFEGGENGWLFHEIKDLFCYTQIIHQGENTTGEWKVSNKVPLCEVVDLMRAIGFYPSEYEARHMQPAVKYTNFMSTNFFLKKSFILDYQLFCLNSY